MMEVMVEAVRECKVSLLGEQQQAIKMRANHFCDFLIDKVVKQMCKEMLSTVLRQQANAIITSYKQPVLSDPFMPFVEKIASVVCREASNDIVKGALRDLTFEYISNIRKEELFSEGIAMNVIRQVVASAYDECVIERICQEMLEKHAERVVEPLCLKVIEELSDDDDRQMLDSMFDSYLEKQLIQNPVDRILFGGDKLTYNKIADKVIADQLAAEDIEAEMLDQFKLE